MGGFWGVWQKKSDTNLKENHNSNKRVTVTCSDPHFIVKKSATNLKENHNSNSNSFVTVMIFFEICSTFFNNKITLLFTLFNHKKQRNSTVDILIRY